jgi:hypothetical protein
VPQTPHASYRRLARYDCTGLCWLLRGCEVVALTESTAAIRHPGGSVTTYRRFNKPPLGPVGDNLDDFRTGPLAFPIEVTLRQVSLQRCWDYRPPGNLSSCYPN